MALAGQQTPSIERAKPLNESFKDPENVLKQSQVLCPGLFAPYETDSADKIYSFLLENSATPFLKQPREEHFTQVKA